MSEHTGGCLCGIVRFVVTGPFSSFHLCHCNQCQRTNGSAFAANLMAAADSLSLTQGQASVRRYDVPGRAISSVYCLDCGSALPYLSNTGAAVIVPVGSLDEPPPRLPDRHIFWEERASWYRHVHSIPQDEGFDSSD